MKKNIFFALFALITLASCVKTDPIKSKNPNNLLVGTWIKTGYDDDNLIYAAANEFDEDKAGYTFKEDGTLEVRQNSGRCGTPPIVYANYTGTWKKGTNDTILIKAAYWGGENTYKIYPTELNSNTLKLKFFW